MNRFTLVRLPTLAQAQERVAKDPARRVIRAGGIDLLDRMKEGLDEPDELIELHAVAGEEAKQMRGIQATSDGGWRVGALVTLAQIADFEDLPSSYAALRQAAGSAATPGIRSAATLGGNLLQRPRCWYYRHADLMCLKKGGTECLAVTGDNRYHAILGGGPSFIVHPSSLASAMVALDAVAHVWSDGEVQSVTVADLFIPPTVDPQREHSLGAGAILLSVELPAPAPGQRSAYGAVKEKQSHDWPLVEAAVRCTVQDSKMTDVRVGLGHVAPVPWRSTDAEAVLEGQAPADAKFVQAARAATAKASPLEHNAYKVPMVQGLMREVLHRATGLPLPA